MLLLAPNSTNTLLAAILFTAVSLPLGLVIGYVWAYRFKRQYVRVARELANLRGQNFRGELSTVGMPQGAARRVSTASHERQPSWQDERAVLTSERDRLAGELAECRQQTERLQQQLDDALAADEAGVPATNPPPPPSVSLGTEAWQLAQLHKEQIAMQLKLDDYLEQIHQLQQQRDHSQVQAKSVADQFQHLRQLLAQQEAVIASVERERDSMATRVVELEGRVRELS